MFVNTDMVFISLSISLDRWFHHGAKRPIPNPAKTPSLSLCHCLSFEFTSPFILHKCSSLLTASAGFERGGLFYTLLAFFDPLAVGCDVVFAPSDKTIAENSNSSTSEATIKVVNSKM